MEFAAGRGGQSAGNVVFVSAPTPVEASALRVAGLDVNMLAQLDLRGSEINELRQCPSLEVRDSGRFTSVANDISCRIVHVGVSGQGDSMLDVLGGSLESTSFIILGGEGVGRLEANGGKVTCADLSIGSTPGESVATFSFDREHVATSVIVGDEGAGRLRVDQGALLTGDTLVVGKTHVGALEIDGFLDEREAGGDFTRSEYRVRTAEIGRAVTGTATVRDGGGLRIEGDGIVGPGRIEVTEDGNTDLRSALFVSALRIGRLEGAGELIVEKGASVGPAFEGIGTDITIGDGGAGTVHARETGPANGETRRRPASLNCRRVDVGVTHEATLTLSAGGVLSAEELLIAEAGGSGRVLVEGEPAGVTTDTNELNIANRVRVGGLGPASLSITAGAFADLGALAIGMSDDSAAEAEAAVRIEQAQAQARSIAMTDRQSRLFLNEALLSGINLCSVAPSAQAFIDLESGSELVFEPGGSLLLGGQNPDSIALLTLQGENTRVRGVGDSGSLGTLLVGAAGAGKGSVVLVEPVGEQGPAVFAETVRIENGRFSLRPATHLTSRSITVGNAGSGFFDDIVAELIVNSRETADGLDPAVVCQELRVHADGELDFCPVGHLVASQSVTIEAGGRIQGSGAIQTPSFSGLGRIVVGCSPGELVIEGDVSLGDASQLIVEAAGTAPEQRDLLRVAGKAVIAGTLEVHFLDGYLPKNGDSLEFIEAAGGLTGQFATLSFPGLAPGFEATAEFTADGRMRLIALNDAVAGEGAALDPGTFTDLGPAACGAGLCGAGVLGVGPAILPMVIVQRRWIRRRTRETESAGHKWTTRTAG